MSKSDACAALASLATSCDVKFQRAVRRFLPTSVIIKNVSPENTFGNAGYLVMMRNSPERYGTVAMTLHWLIAAMVLINIGLGLYFTDLPQDYPNKALFTQTHKSI